MTPARLNPSSSRQGDLVLGLDASTTACKCIVWDASGKPLAEGRGSIQLNSPSPLAFEQDAEAWWSATVQAIREAVSQVNPDRVRGMCIANQRETFVLADGSGRPLRPGIVWMDERCRDQVAAVRQSGQAPRLHAVTGKPASVTPSFYKILWLREQEPELFVGDPLVLDVHAFLAFRLTGRFRTSLPSADPLGLVDVQAGDWSPEVVALAGLGRGQVPEIVPAGSEIGLLTQEAANACGLRAGVPLVGGAGDGQAAGLGAGLQDPHRAYLNLGTAVVSGVFSTSYRTSMAFRTMAGAAPGSYILETDLKGGTFTVNWLVDRWLKHEGAPSQILKRLEAEAQSLPAGSQGLVLVPYWNGVMNPYWDDDAAGLVMGWRECHGPAHLYRAILEGIAFEQRLQTSAVERATGSAVEEFVVMGGGATSDLWCQIVADVTGKRVRRAGSTEATSLGVAILAAWGTGLHLDLSTAVEAMTSIGDCFEPGPNQPRYDRMYRDVYQGLFEAVRPQMDRLAHHLREG